MLFLIDPGGAAAMAATSTIYAGLQLLLPGDMPAHKTSTPSAARIVKMWARKCYTVVDGEKLPMQEGDLILTLGGRWHDHGHGGAASVVWLDALDLPLFVYLEGLYAIEAPLQKPRNRPGYAGGRASRWPAPAPPPRSQRLSDDALPWRAWRSASLLVIAASRRTHDYVNPETGQSCLPTKGLAASDGCTGASQSFRGVDTLRARSSTSWARHIHHQRRPCPGPQDSPPPFAAIDHKVGDDGPAAFLVRIHDAAAAGKARLDENCPQQGQAEEASDERRCPHAGGGIGGLATAKGLAQKGYAFSNARPSLGEIGAGQPGWVPTHPR
ncbi:MAG: hypothetical protein U0232_32850 [Thermomicrobiales bacterium]